MDIKLLKRSNFQRGLLFFFETFCKLPTAKLANVMKT